MCRHCRRQHKQQQVACDLPVVVLCNAVGEEVGVKIKVGVFQAQRQTAQRVQPHSVDAVHTGQAHIVQPQEHL